MKTITFFGETVGDEPVINGPRARADLECTGCGLLEDEHPLVREGRCDGYRRDDGSPRRSRRAADAFGDAVQELALATSSFFAKNAIVGVRVSEELGLALGIPSGRSAAIATACGMVQVDVEPDRRAELTVAALRGALAAAVAEIDEHNGEYKHVTPKDKLDHWRLLYVGEALC